MENEDVRLAAIAVNRSQSLNTRAVDDADSFHIDCFGKVPCDKLQAQKTEQALKVFQISSYCTRLHVSF